MFWSIAVALMILWALGLKSSYAFGGFIYIPPVIAVMVMVFGFLQGRRTLL